MKRALVRSLVIQPILVAVFSFLAFLVLALLSPAPLPLRYNLPARLDYTLQTLLFVTGWSSGYDARRLASWMKYSLPDVDDSTSSSSSSSSSLPVDFNSPSSPIHFPFRHLTPLPDDVDTSQPAADWEPRLAAAIDAVRPAVLRGWLHNDARTFNTSLLRSRFNLDHLVNRVYAGKKIPVFTNMKNDKSAVMMPFGQFATELVASDVDVATAAADGRQLAAEEVARREHKRNGMSDDDAAAAAAAAAPPSPIRVRRYARCLDDSPHPPHSVFHTYNHSFLFDHFLGPVAAAEADMSRAVNGNDYACMFVGGRAVMTRMHSDVGTTVFMNVRGRKQWILFPPSESMYFLAVPHLYNVAYNSYLDVFGSAASMDATHELARKHARGWLVTLEPGDVLYFPAFTWHAVRNLDTPTIAIDIGLIDPVTALPQQPLLALGSMLNMKANFKVAACLWRGHRNCFKKAFFAGYMKDTEVFE